MKKIGACSLAIFILVLSVFSVIPVNVYADDDKTVIPTVDGHFGLTTSDAQSKVSAHKDIYYDNDKRAFAYTPSSSYNWTLCNDKGAVTSTHLSDKQVVALLCSSNRWDHNRTLIASFVSNNNIFRGFMSGVGSLFTGDSDNGTKILDIVTGNYNYLDALNYDEDSQTIKMSNDNGSVDKLREEIKLLYYKDNGMFYVSNRRGKPTDIIKSSWYDDNTLYQEDFNIVSDYDYAIGDGRTAFYFNQSDFAYFYLYTKSESYFGSGNPYNYASLWLQFTDTNLNPITLPNITKSLNCTDSEYVDTSNYTVDFSKFAIRFYKWFSSNVRGDYTQVLLSRIISSADTGDDTSYYGTNPYIHWATNNLTDDSSYDYINSAGFWSKSDKTLVGFVSYEKLFDYIHGESSAYLGSAINKVGEDISYSIKNMDENLGSKMDQLIDSINDKKGSMTSDELQDAIDKGIEDLTKNTEDIKDNTSSILDILKEQNDILLQILGVTEYIAYNTTKDDGTDYTVSDLKNVFNTMYNGVGNAILYGKNTVTDSGSSAATQTARQSFKLSTAGAAASPDRAVVVYSADSSVATQDINNMDVHDGLFGKFPFSIPYQLYEWLQVLEADPVAPVFNYNYGFLIGKKDDPDCNLRIDLSIYEPWADQAKSFQRLGFTLLMALFIYNKFKGNSII